MRVAVTVAALGLAIALPSATARPQERGESAGGRKTFKTILYFVPGATGGEGFRVEHLKEVLTESDGASRLALLVDGQAPQRLQALTVTPGQDNAVVKYKDLTFRISGLYRGPQKDRMYLKVSFDQGGQAAVKEFLAGLDQSVVVTYPMAGGEKGSLVALLVPTG